MLRRRLEKSSFVQRGGKKDEIEGVRDCWLLSESFVGATCLSAESSGWNRLSDKEPKATGGLGLKREMERDCFPPTP